MRQDVKNLVSDYNRTEEDLKAIQSVGMLIGDVLKEMDDDKFMFVQSLSFKDKTTAIILGILFVERIYLGQVGLGLLKLFLNFFIIGLIWWFIDLFTITKRVKEYNFQQFSEITAYS